MEDLSITNNIRLAVFGYRQHNIVHCRGLYYGWPWTSGEFSLAGYMSGAVPTAVVGKTILRVKNLIDIKLGPFTPEEENSHDWMAEQEIEKIITENKAEEISDDIRLVVSGYREYNIVHCKGLYFGWPWPAGEFSWDKYLSRTFLQAVAGTSILNVKKLIDIKLGPPTAQEENQHDWIVSQRNEDVNAGVLQKELTKSSRNERFLLIKQWGFGFWSDMHDVWAKLLLAEITNRQPVIFWGKESLYTVDGHFNSFEQYFLPVSSYKWSDVVNEAYSFYPPIWNSFNVFLEDLHKHSKAYRAVPNFTNCNANVLVSDLYYYAHDVMPWIGQGHPAYGLSEDDVYRYIHNKYIKLQPDIAKEIDDFYHAHMETKPILAVQVRGGLKLKDGIAWTGANEQAPHEINNYLRANPSARIFLMTDDEAILEQYKQMYGNILIYTDCTRRNASQEELCLTIYPDQRRKGIEIIKDTYLACRCDSFIGNQGSGISHAISRLKVWDKDKIKLLWGE